MLTGIKKIGYAQYLAGFRAMNEPLPRKRVGSIRSAFLGSGPGSAVGGVQDKIIQEFTFCFLELSPLQGLPRLRGTGK